MNLASRTLGGHAPSAAGLFTLPYRGMTRVAATIALWHRRADDRRQLAMMLNTSSPGLLHDTSILCTEAEVEANKPFWRA